MAAAAITGDGDRSSPPLKLSCSAFAILRRSSSLFFSSSVLGPLLVSSLFLFLFRSLIRYLTHQFVASQIHGDPSFLAVTTYIFVFFLLVVFNYVGFFILYSALHFTALLAVLFSLLNKPSPGAQSFIATFRHGCSLGNDRLDVFRKAWLVARHIQLFCLLFLLFLIAVNGGDISAVRSGATVEMAIPPFAAKMVMSPFVAPFRLMDDVAARLPVLIVAWGVLELTLSVVLINLTPWVLLFLHLDDVKRTRFWYVVKQGGNLMSVMLFQAIGIKMIEVAVAGEIGRRGGSVMGGGSSWFAAVVESVMEAYFVVVWLVFYVAARGRDAESKGRAFGVQDLEDCLARLH